MENSREGLEIGSVLDALEATVSGLVPGGLSESELRRVEIAVAEREQCVQRLSDLAREFPSLFTPSHLERVRASLASGKAALEEIVEVRRAAWANSIALNRSRYFLRSMFTPDDAN